jgi:hypothetical protein
LRWPTIVGVFDDYRILDVAYIVADSSVMVDLREKYQSLEELNMAVDELCSNFGFGVDWRP